MKGSQKICSGGRGCIDTTLLQGSALILGMQNALKYYSRKSTEPFCLWSPCFTVGV